MQENDIAPTHEIYLDYLTQINGKEFSHREIDVIACFIDSKQPTEIAQILFLDRRTVSSHTVNIKKKLNLKSIESTKKIVDFIQSSDKFEIIKDNYLRSLFIRVKFEETLRKLSRIITRELSFCYEYSHQIQENVGVLVTQFKNHLKQAGLTARNRSAEGFKHIFNMFPDVNEDTCYTIYLIPKGLSNSLKDINDIELLKVFLLEENYKSGEIIIVQEKNKTPSDIPAQGDCNPHALSLEKSNYYIAVFEVLKKLYPNVNIEKFISEFKEKCSYLDSYYVIAHPPSLFRASSFCYSV